MSSPDSPCLSGAEPLPLSQENICNPGFFCPNNTESSPAQYCPPTPDCLLTRLQLVRNICDGPQGIYEPVACPRGYFCAPGGKEVRLCPQGHFCPLGTVVPFPCGPTSVCPQGSDREFILDGFIAILIIDLLFLAIVLKPYFKARFRSWSTTPDGKRSKEESDCNLDLESSRLDKSAIRHRMQRVGLTNEDFNWAPDMMPKFVALVKSCVGSSEIGFSFGFEQLSLTLANGKRLIAPQSGSISQGSVWCVMGPSGAGKTSFVNLLMGKTSRTTGRLYVNGVPSQITKFKKLIGYVPQDDVIVPECTVRENIMHSAMIRLPRTWTDTQRIELVDTLLSCLNLVEVQHNIVGDEISSYISGGQRKRVSIGIELAAAPMALFLDEPTSGLDATTSLSIMRLLQNLSKQGVTVICILHQPRPEILDHIDGITLLGNGHQIYHDQMSGLADYFRTLGFDISSRTNIADAALDIISGGSAMYHKSGQSFTAESLANVWESYPARSPQSLSSYGQDISSREQLESMNRSIYGRGLPRHRQVYLCFLRSLKQQLVRWNSFGLEVVVGAVAGLLIGLSLYQLRGQHFQGAYYSPFQILSSALNYTTVPEIGLLCNTAIGLASAAPGVKIFGEEKQVYQREASAGHSRLAYYLGKTISAIPRIAISAMHFTAFYCILATPWMSFWKIYLTNLLYFYCIYGLASAVSMMVRREDGPLLAMIVSLIIGVFGGYGPPLYNVKEWHLEWFWRLCPGIWFTEAYFDQHLARVVHLYDLDAAANWTGYVRGRFSIDITLLFIIGTVYRMAAYGGLIFFNR
ncbi:hypothetical protein BKA67DRAFT_558140 [Truncatella angustata]|uniref:ABC transporter domain-containing protein n=1 Tax=Truncatella angustata TaxID=152316 RepID=A0A9P8UTZ3_9PEZI|nr:uncharacterized protein BKA67DRAFT_558140 [Truncatella angustata]KAH6658467.1 hypothetical protein BKA67DRAFT_558140 [Truncatella angustata]